MKSYTAKEIRNIGLFGHGGEGKTTLTEAMLYNAGLLDRMGRVEDGTTTTDYDPEEVKRTVSISMAVAPYEWKNTKINIIDTPGGYVQKNRQAKDDSNKSNGQGKRQF